MSLILNSSTQPSGSRRLTLTMLAVRDQADRFAGVPRGMGKPLRFLAAFQEAFPYLGLPPQAYTLVAWLVKQTMAHDWEEGSRPICWPSSRRQEEFLALSETQVKTLNRLLFEAGVLVMRDSETGKRYGRRDLDKRIIEAYGFDLSPLAYRYDEFIRLAAEARAERERMRVLRKRATCARRAIRAAGEALEAMAALPPEWVQLAAETAELVSAIRSTGRSGDLALIVKSLESRKAQVETWLRERAEPVETDPLGSENRPHSISTNLSLDPPDTVIASEKRSRAERAVPPALSSEPGARDLEGSAEFKPFERVEKLHPGELIRLAPRLADHVPQPYPDWGDVVAAAATGLARDLGVSQSLWGEACLVLGRQLATVALAVVSTKPKDHFTRGAGGYFAAMVKRAKTGELNLDRSLWKLRRAGLGSSEASRPRSATMWQG